MNGQSINVEVDSDGRVRARRWEDDARSDPGQVGWRELDADLVRIFERWLSLRDRRWREDEIRAFGTLLHRCLFPEPVWSWWLREAMSGERPIRLSLSFPGDGHYSRLAAVPWEYLHTPDRNGRRGVYLAYESGLVLSRYIPLETGVRSLRTESAVKVLAVVSRPNDRRLGEVVAEPVLEALHGLDPKRFAVAVCRDPTATTLAKALADEKPHLVHFMGHGEFDADEGRAALALSAADGGADWVDDRRFADLLRRPNPMPRVVVLHACEGAKTDYQLSFAGLAPQLVRSGVQCVVAMQYAITNETATEFSTAFYEQLDSGVALDEAVQECRWRISGLTRRDAQLIGVPVVYLYSRDTLLSPLTPETTDAAGRV